MQVEPSWYNLKVSAELLRQGNGRDGMGEWEGGREELGGR